MVEQLVLQLVDGGSKPTSPLHYRIDPMPHGEAKTFVETWHYSHRMPTGKNICFGVWCNGAVYATIVYGIGVNPYQAAFLGVKSVIEIKRMCRREPKEGFELSRFIRLTTKMARKQQDFEAVVAFADPEQGHEGTVYKAAGFTHEGMSNAEWHLIGEDGEKRHRRFAFRMARRNGITVAEAREALGMKRVETAPKHRWVLRRCPGGAWMPHMPLQDIRRAGRTLRKLQLQPRRQVAAARRAERSDSAAQRPGQRSA